MNPPDNETKADSLPAEVSPVWIQDRSWKTHWEKVEELDGGGQGEAYQAHRRSDGKIAFLKIIKSKNDPERRARFFREATAYDSFGIVGIPRLIEINAQHHADVKIDSVQVVDPFGNSLPLNPEIYIPSKCGP